MIARELPVRTRLTVDDEGAFARSETVYCPRREHSVPLVECDVCPRCKGGHFAQEGSFIVCEAPARRAHDEVTIADVMTTDVVCVRPSVPLFTLAGILLSRNIGGAPVVDEDGHAVGMISKTDALRAYFERRDDGGTVGEAMTPLAFTLEETQPLVHAAAMMSTEGVHRVPVVDDDGRVIGIVSALDITRQMARRVGY